MSLLLKYWNGALRWWCAQRRQRAASWSSCSSNQSARASSDTPSPGLASTASHRASRRASSVMGTPAAAAGLRPGGLQRFLGRPERGEGLVVGDLPAALEQPEQR